MLVVIPFYRGDVQAVERNLKWAISLDGHVSLPCLLHYESGTPIEPVQVLAETYFDKVDTHSYNRWDGDQKWPIPQNRAFQMAARHIDAKLRQPWFWWESDMVPLKKRWLAEIANEYAKAGKPFMGAYIGLYGGYMAGCGVYPPKVVDHSVSMMIAHNEPWDIVGGRDIRDRVHDASHLIHHDVVPRGAVRTFGEVEQLRDIGDEAVVYHPCKDGSLVDLLAKSNGSLVTLWTKFKEERKSRAKSARELIRVRRQGAIGDVIMASAVAQKLYEHGYDPTIACNLVCSPPLLNHAHVKVSHEYKDGDVVLDDVYEKLTKEQKNAKPYSRIFAESAYAQLNEQGKAIEDYANLTPILSVTSEERFQGSQLIEKYPKPWIAVCPRSNSWPNRTVPQSIWSQAAHMGNFGTWFWTGTDAAPAGYVDLSLRTLRKLMGVLIHMDLVVSVDTGPAHLAAGLGRPLLMIKQNVSSAYTLPEQRDWQDISTELACLSCRETPCPINATNPPCGLIDPLKIVVAVEKRLKSLDSQDVSAVIPFYKATEPDQEKMNRLNRCLAHVLPQVSEVILSVDGPAKLDGMTRDPRIKVVRHFSGQRRGFGKTCNLGARYSNGRYIMLLNDDLYLHPDAVQKMLEVTDESTACTGCLLWFPDGTVQHGGTVRRPGDIGWGHIDHHKQSVSIKSPVEMENVTYAVAMIRRTAFFEVLGFDEIYDVYCEDNDLNLKFRQAGWKVMYTPHAQGIHEESKTCSPMKQQLAEDASIKFRKKWDWYFVKNKNNSMGKF